MREICSFFGIGYFKHDFLNFDDFPSPVLNISEVRTFFIFSWNFQFIFVSNENFKVSQYYFSLVWKELEHLRSGDFKFLLGLNV